MKIRYLMFVPNNASCRVVDVPPEGVVVIRRSRQWRIEPNTGATRHRLLTSYGPYAIGKARPIGDWRNGIIGVYDVEQTEHLNAMVHDAIEAVRDCSVYLVD